MKIANSAVRAFRFFQVAAFLGLLMPGAAVAEFGPAATLSAGGQNAGLAQVDTDAAGNAIVVWRRSNGTNLVIQARSRSAGGTLGPVEEITAAGQNADLPQIGVDADGDAVIVWIRSDGTNNRVQVRSLFADGSLGPVKNVSAAGVDATNPRVAVGPNGRSVIMWQLSDRMEARARTAAGVLSETQTISGTGAAVANPGVGIADNGSAVFAWVTFGGGISEVQVRGRTAGGDLGSIQSVSPSSAQAGTPDIAVDASGDALLAWANSTLSPTRIQARSLTSAGTLGPVKNLSGASTAAVSPQIGMRDDGDAIVVWQRTDFRIQARTMSAEGALGGIQNISSSGGSSTQHQVAYDDNGVAVFVWKRLNAATKPNIQARSRSAGGTLTPIENLFPAQPPGLFVANPQIAMENGAAAAVWERAISSSARIQTATGP